MDGEPVDADLVQVAEPGKKLAQDFLHRGFLRYLETPM